MALVGINLLGDCSTRVGLVGGGKPEKAINKSIGLVDGGVGFTVGPIGPVFHPFNL